MPNQTALRLRGQLETFANPQAFNPKNPTRLRRRDHQLATAEAWNSLVHEPILKFQRRLHADGLKTVARKPVAQRDLFTNLLCVKKFTRGLRGWA